MKAGGDALAFDVGLPARTGEGLSTAGDHAMPPGLVVVLTGGCAGSCVLSRMQTYCAAPVVPAAFELCGQTHMKYVQSCGSPAAVTAVKPDKRRDVALDPKEQSASQDRVAEWQKQNNHRVLK
jgi:hypothetical protein